MYYHIPEEKLGGRRMNAGWEGMRRWHCDPWGTGSQVTLWIHV